MKPLKYFLFIALPAAAFIMNSCSTPIKTVGAWINVEKIKPEPYKSVLIVALIGDVKAKTIIENDLADAAVAKGMKAFKSNVIFGPYSGKTGIPSEAKITAKAAELGCDAIFTVALLDKQTTTTYNPGTTMVYGGYSGYGYGGYYPRYGYYGHFGSYYNYGSVVYSPGYYSTNKTYQVESNLFDATSGELVMSIESKAVNPGSLPKSSLEFTKTLAEEMANLRATVKN